MWKTLKRKPKQLLDQPDFPEEFRYIWEWYLELKGKEPITFTELKCWSDITQQKPLAWEVDFLKAIDRVYWRCIHE